MPRSSRRAHATRAGARSLAIASTPKTKTHRRRSPFLWGSDDRLSVTSRAPRDPMTRTQLHDEQRGPFASAADAASATFLFADIAGYTALTEAHGDETSRGPGRRVLQRCKRRAPDVGRDACEDDRGRAHAPHPRPSEGRPTRAAYHARAAAGPRRPRSARR